MPKGMGDGKIAVLNSLCGTLSRRKGVAQMFNRTPVHEIPDNPGIGRAKVKIGMANIAYNMLRYVFQEGRRAGA